MSRIEEQWQSFQSSVISVDAPPAQKREMKIAFYGGVKALLNIQMKIADLSEPSAIMAMNNIQAELSQFSASIQHKG